eukprot:IDg22372t1
MPISASPIIASFQQQAHRPPSIQPATTAAPQTPSVSPCDSTSVRKRPLQHVLTRADRLKIVKWMVMTSSTEGDKHISAKAVRQFPACFRGTANANILKASRLWKNKAEFLNESGDFVQRGTSSSITRVTKSGFKRVYSKAKSGRGRKRAAWVDAVHQDLVAEFDRLRKLGFQIVSRALTGKLQTSPAKELFIEKEVAFHLGVLARQFRNKELDEIDVENADETHFVINIDNGRTLGFSGESEVKYADVVSGGEGMTMVVRISGGRDAIIEAPFMVFKNDSRSHPIRGVPEDVPGIAYRTGPKGWMDTVVMPEWLSERRIIGPLPHERKRILYVDNCSGHNYTTALAAAADTIRTEIRYFPKNVTHLVQPCDSFVIQKIKRAWTTRWEQHKMERIMCNDWTDGSGKIKNPGKHFSCAWLLLQFVKLTRSGMRRA